MITLGSYDMVNNKGFSFKRSPPFYSKAFQGLQALLLLLFLEGWLLNCCLLLSETQALESKEKDLSHFLPPPPLPPPHKQTPTVLSPQVTFLGDPSPGTITLPRSPDAHQHTEQMRRQSWETDRLQSDTSQVWLCGCVPPPLLFLRCVKCP